MHDLARLDLEVDALEHLEMAERLVDAFGADHRLRHQWPTPPPGTGAVFILVAALTPREKRFSRKYCPISKMLLSARYHKRGHQHREHLERSIADRLQLIEELVRHRYEREQGSVLEHRDGLVAGRRNDDPHGLGSTMRRIVSGRLIPSAEAASGLTGTDRSDTGTHDLGHVCAFGQRQAEQAGYETGQQRAGTDAEQLAVELEAEQVSDLRIERKTEGVALVQNSEIAEEHQQHHAGHSPEATCRPTRRSTARGSARAA